MPPMWLRPRAPWLVLIACGLVLGWIGAVQPLLDADQHSEKVTLYLKASIAAPLCIGYGLLYVVRLDWATRRLGTRTKATPLGYAVLAALAVLGIGLYVLVRMTLEGRGYRFHGL